jgi:hypothetical protein
MAQETPPGLQLMLSAAASAGCVARHRVPGTVFALNCESRGTLSASAMSYMWHLDAAVDSAEKVTDVRFFASGHRP